MAQVLIFFILYFSIPIIGLLLIYYNPYKYYRLIAKKVTVKKEKWATPCKTVREKYINYGLIEEGDKAYITSYNSMYCENNFENFEDLVNSLTEKGVDVVKFNYKTNEIDNNLIKTLNTSKKGKFSIKKIDTKDFKKRNQSLYKKLKEQHFLLIDSKKRKQLWIEKYHEIGETESYDNKFIANAEYSEEFPRVNTILNYFKENSTPFTSINS